MATQRSRRLVEALLATAGIRINGGNPWDIRVHDERFFARVLADGSLGAGEAYMDNWWDCPRLDEFFFRLLRHNIEDQVRTGRQMLYQNVLSRIGNPQHIARAFRSTRQHYDLGNDLFRAMLDSRMMYSCAYWKDADTLEEAQEKKLDLTCRKSQLQPGMHVLDVGCGWGGFAKFAAERYRVKVTGITLSEQQATLARNVCEGWPVDIRLQDYRTLRGTFDRIVSIGMFEHVGPNNYRTFMTRMAALLKDDGLFLLHSIGANVSSYATDAWLERYIFPGSVLPSVSQIGKAIEGLFVMEDWHSFGAYYDRTLMAWHNNFIANGEKLKTSYDDRFFRMWTYYLLSCAGSFRARKNQLWQIVLSKRGSPAGYESYR
ncbi:MAG TPA: cyclopropane fatty acyl phospholipid synthase [Chryseosolibacter sp.]